MLLAFVICISARAQFGRCISLLYICNTLPSRAAPFHKLNLISSNWMWFGPSWIVPNGILLSLKTLPELPIKLCSQCLNVSSTKDARFVMSGCSFSSTAWWTRLLNHACRLERALSHSELHRPQLKKKLLNRASRLELHLAMNGEQSDRFAQGGGAPR